MNSLRKRELCPIHHSFFCCGRESNRPERKPWQRKTEKPRRPEAKAKWKLVAPGVWRIPDEHHPRGYRERRNKSAMTALLKIKVINQNGCCKYCGEEFKDFREITPDHVSPRMMGGAMRDDHPDNIVAACADCNQEKGSRRDFTKSVEA